MSQQFLEEHQRLCEGLDYMRTSKDISIGIKNLMPLKCKELDQCIIQPGVHMILLIRSNHLYI